MYLCSIVLGISGSKTLLSAQLFLLIIFLIAAKAEVPKQQVQIIGKVWALYYGSLLLMAFATHFILMTVNNGKR